MKQKLAQKVDEGYSGWDDPECYDYIAESLLKLSAATFAGFDNQAVDAANLAMMIWYQNREK